MADCLAELGRRSNRPATDDSSSFTEQHLRLQRNEQAFERHLVENPPRLTFSTQELTGAPTWFLELAQAPSPDQRVFGVGPSDYYIFMRHVSSSDARKRMYMAHANRGGVENLRLLQHIVDTRRALASTAGADSYYELQRKRMNLPAGQDAKWFVSALGSVVHRLADHDLEALRAFSGRGLALRRWDVLYELEKARVAVVGAGEHDEASLVPASTVTAWLTAYFAKLAAVRFAIDREAAWHSSVSCWQVQPLGSGAIGSLCLDLLPREGKYYNYASFGVPAAASAPAMAVVLGNVNKRLSADEIERLFSEFSVALTLLVCGNSCLIGADADLAWQSVQRAFFQFQAFSDESLAVLAAIAPAAVPQHQAVMATRANRYFAAPLAYSRQLMLAEYDLELAGPAPVADVMALWASLERRSSLGHEPASIFPSRLNFVAGAGAGTSYLAVWGEAFALDLSTRIDCALCERHRKHVRRLFFPTKPPDGSLSGRLGRAGLSVQQAIDALTNLIQSNALAPQLARLSPFAQIPEQSLP
jgi:Zn-dependent oligopeptidase